MIIIRNIANPFKTEDAEIRPEGEHERRLVHEVDVRHVAVGEQHLVDGPVAQESRQVGLRDNRDTVGVARTGELGREPPAVDTGNLRCRE